MQNVAKLNINAEASSAAHTIAKRKADDEDSDAQKKCLKGNVVSYGIKRNIVYFQIKIWMDSLTSLNTLYAISEMVFTASHLLM